MINLTIGFCCVLISGFIFYCSNPAMEMTLRDISACLFNGVITSVLVMFIGDKYRAKKN